MLAKFGEAMLGRREARHGRSKTEHFREKSAKMGRTKACLDLTGASGSRFLRKTAKRGLDAIKQGQDAVKQCIFMKRLQKTL